MTEPKEAQRRPYSSPTLTEHGSVERLTQIGIGNKVEKHPFKPGSKVRPKPK